MAQTSEGHLLPNVSVITTTPTPLSVDPVFSCNLPTVAAQCTSVTQSFPLDFPAPPRPPRRLDEAMEVVVSASPTSSGIGDSMGLFDSPCGVEPSPVLSIASSLNSESRFVQSVHIPTCSPHPGAARLDDSGRVSTMTTDNHNFCSNSLSNGSPPYRTHRHQSLPTDSTVLNRVKYNGARRQSSPGAQRTGEILPSPPVSTPPVPGGAPPTTVRNISLTNSFNKLNIRGRCRGPNGMVVDMLARSVPGTVHPIPSSLEPIPQGQELLVNTASVSTTTSPTSSIYSPGGIHSVRQSCKRVIDPTQTNGSATRRKLAPCCPCHNETLPPVDAGVHVDATDARAAYASRLYKSNHSSVDEDIPDLERSSASGRGVDTRNNGKAATHWTRELLGRFRANPNTEQADLRSPILNGRRNSGLRSGDSNRSVDKIANGSHFPDTIDPRRLPKTHGPSSNCLQFSKKPLHHPVISNLPSYSQPIPMSINPGSQASPVLKASSWRPRKQSHRVRWLSQSHGEESGRESSDGFFGSSSLYARLSCSAVEEFQGAVDMVAATNRQQVFASSVSSSRGGVRIRRASESEHLLVISKSHSESKEESVSCSFGHFDEDHVFNTLFRYSTCYDVLPDSGKLVMVDSRLGVIRSIRVLLENGVQAAPIWHAPSQSVTGLFSQELALHLLASLHSTAHVNESLHEDLMAGDLGSQAKPASPSPHSLTDGLRIWGKRRLCEVLRLFHSEHDRGMCLPDPFDIDVIVTPQTRLRKALSRLLHCKTKASSLQHNVSSTSTYQQQHQQLPDCHIEMECCFSMDEPHAGNGIRQHQQSHLQGSTSASFRHPSEPSKSSSSFPNHLFSPMHLIVMDPSSGNVLGILGPDRLLAYLRLRLDELPYSTQLLSPVDTIPGLRWTERSWSLKNCRNRHSSTEHNPAIDPIPSPILSSKSTCSEALRALSIWLPHLPALPVICSNEGAATHTNVLLGFISPGDLLHFVLDHSPDMAVTQPVSKILEAKLMYCRFHQDCICHTHEMIVDVLDRMFRLKAPCLVMCDAPRPGSTSGSPVGVVTAKDLLRAIVTPKPSRSDSGLAGMSRTNHERCDSPLVGGYQWVEESPCSDAAMSNQNARKQTLIHNSDSLLGASFDDGASLSSSSGSTCSAHSDSVHMGLVSRVAPIDGCGCACHHVPDGKKSYSGETEHHFPSKTTDNQFHRTTVDTMLSSSGTPTQFRSPSSSSTQSPSLFHAPQPHSTPKPSGPGLPTRDVGNYEKKYSKRGDDEEAVFPMD